MQLILFSTLLIFSLLLLNASSFEQGDEVDKNLGLDDGSQLFTTTILANEKKLSSAKKLCFLSNNSFEGGGVNFEQLNYPRISADGRIVLLTSPKRNTYVYHRRNKTTYQLLQDLPSLLPVNSFEGSVHDTDVSADGSTLIVALSSPYPQLGSANFWIYRWNFASKLYQLEFQSPTYSDAITISPKLSANGSTALIGVTHDTSQGVAYVFIRENSTWIQQDSELTVSKSALSPPGEDAMICAEKICYMFSMNLKTRKWKQSSPGFAFNMDRNFDFNPTGNYLVGSNFIKRRTDRPKLVVLKKNKVSKRWSVVQNIVNALFVGFVKQNEAAEAKMIVSTQNGISLMNLRQNHNGLWVAGTSFISATAGRENIVLINSVVIETDEAWTRSIRTKSTLVSILGNALIQYLQHTFEVFDDGSLYITTQLESWDCPDGLYV